MRRTTEQVVLQSGKMNLTASILQLILQFAFRKIEQSGEDEGEEEIVHIKNTTATEGSKYCTMKVYGQKFWLRKLRRVPFFCSLHLPYTVKTAS